MSRRHIEYSVHHLLPKSRWWDKNDLNEETIRVTTHRAIHTLFANMIFPEQLERLTDMTCKVLLPEVQAELYQRLSCRDIHNPNERYKEWALLLPKHLKKDG